MKEKEKILASLKKMLEDRDLVNMLVCTNAAFHLFHIAASKQTEFIARLMKPKPKENLEVLIREEPLWEELGEEAYPIQSKLNKLATGIMFSQDNLPFLKGFIPDNLSHDVFLEELREDILETIEIEMEGYPNREEDVEKIISKYR